MLKALLGSPRVDILEKAIGASTLRQKVISDNIANVNTPKFKKSEVQFEELLAKEMSQDKLQMARTNAAHMPMQAEGIPGPRVNTITQTSYRTDGNNVDIDTEMAGMAKNNIYYNAVVQQLSGYFSGLRSAIKEGKG
ncbi:flagellar basal body rod protein FlgB [Azotosporobacter soli]|uniref:flagellar basal body rod protein FlgB n=1 Tax=Azotosporobacter soli TaxID=3055040 RepID=UPI0031FEB50A